MYGYHPFKLLWEHLHKLNAIFFHYQISEVMMCCILLVQQSHSNSSYLTRSLQLVPYVRSWTKFLLWDLKKTQGLIWVSLVIQLHATLLQLCKLASRKTMMYSKGRDLKINILQERKYLKFPLHFFFCLANP